MSFYYDDDEYGSGGRLEYVGASCDVTIELDDMHVEQLEEVIEQYREANDDW